MAGRMRTTTGQADDVSEHSLVFGKPIYLYHEATNGYVGAEGFGDTRVNVLVASSSARGTIDDELAKHDFMERVFVVVPPQQHTAAMALHKHLAEHAPDASVRLEKRLNDENTQAAEGHGVEYGQTIQLVHVNSTKYVTVRPRLLSATARDAMRVELADASSDDARFTVTSTYAHIRTGADVLFGDDVAFLSEAWRVTLHVGASMATHTASSSTCLELNASNATDCFSIARFAAADSGSLRGNHLVRLFHCASSGYICAGVGPSVVVQSNAAHAIQGLWQLTHVDIKDGSAIATETSTLCLRHLASGHFLSLSSLETEAVLVATRSDDCTFQLTAASLLAGPTVVDNHPYYLRHAPSRAFVGVLANQLRCVARQRLDKAHAFQLSVVAPTEVTESLFLLSLLPHLQTARSVLSKHFGATNGAVHDLLADTKWLQHILSQLVAFCAEATPSRHDLLAELDVTRLLLDLVDDLFRAPWAADSNSPWHDLLTTRRASIGTLAYSLLLVLVRGHRSNAQQCALACSTLVSHLDKHLGADDVFAALLSTDAAFVARLPDTAIDGLVSLVATRGKQPSYLRYLRKLVAFQSKGLPAKQAYLCDILFGSDGAGTHVLCAFRGAEVRCPNGQWVPLQAIDDDEPYVIASLRLLAALATSRNYVAMAAIERLLPRDTVLHILDTARADTMRAALSKLLLTVYVDRLPQSVVPLPRKIVLLGPPGLVDENVFFADLKQRIASALMTSTCASGYLLGLLRICLQLLRFGAYGLESELRTLLGLCMPLLANFDGANDVTNARTTKSTTLAHRLGDRMRSALAKVKSPSIQAIEALPGPVTAPPPVLAKMDGDSKLVLCQMLLCILQRSVDDQLGRVLRVVFEKASRKTSVCLALARTVESAEIEAEEGREWSARHAEIAVACEGAFQTSLFTRLLSPHRLTPILLQLLATDRPDLVSASLDLLGSSYNTHREVLKHLSDVTVVKDETSLQLHGRMVHFAAMLQLYEETSETWLLAPSQDAWKEVVAILRWFTDALTTIETQRLFRGLHIDDVVLSLLLSVGGYLLQPTHKVENEMLVPRLDVLMDASYALVVHYVWRYRDGQAKVATHLAFFQDCVSHRHMRPAIFVALAVDNVGWCQALPHGFIAFLVDLLDEHGNVPEVLDILSALTVCNGIPIKDNQTALSRLLMAPHRPPHVLEAFLSLETPNDDPRTLEVLLCDGKESCANVQRSSKHDVDVSGLPSSDTSLSERFSALLQQLPVSATTTRTPTQGGDRTMGSVVLETNPLLYYAKLLGLLTNLTAGANFVCEARLQGLFPIERLLVALSQPSTLRPITTKLLMVLHEAYLNTEQHVAEVAGSAALIGFVASQPAVLASIFPIDVNTASGFTTLYGHEISYVFDGLLPVLLHFLRRHCDATALHPDLQKTLPELAKSLSEVAARLQKAPFDWVDVVASRKKLALGNDVLDHLVRLLPRGSLLGLGGFPTKHHTNGTTDASLHVPHFAAWLRTAPFYVASTYAEKRKLLSAFLSTDRFDVVLERLVGHVHSSEIARGHCAKHSTLEILANLEQIASTSSRLLLSCGAVVMVVELFCAAHESDTKAVAGLVALGIALLETSQRAFQVQCFALLSADDSSSHWLERVRSRLVSAIDTLASPSHAKLLRDPSDVIALLELHRLLCEGHYAEMQNLLRQQSGPRSINFVELVVRLFCALVKTLRPSHVPLLLKTLETIVELVQGPCEGNQLAVINPVERNDANFVDACMLLLGAREENAVFSAADVYQLKAMCTLALVSLVEGRRDTIVHERLAGQVSLPLLKETLVLFYAHYLKTYLGVYSEVAFDPALQSPEARQREGYFVRLVKIALGQAHLPVVDDEDATPTNNETAMYLNPGFSLYILFHRLVDVPGIGDVLRSSLMPPDMHNGDPGRHTLQPRRSTKHVHRKLKALQQRDSDASYAEAYGFFRKHCASIEVVVPTSPDDASSSSLEAKRLQRFHFPKPPVCQFLTSDMRDTCMEDIARDSPAAKISDLFRRSDALVAEMTHRYLMVVAGDAYFTLGKTISFVLAITINLVLLDCYVDTGDPRFTSVALPASMHPVDAAYNMACVGTVGGVSKDLILLVCAVAQVVVSSFIVCIYALTYGPLIMLEGWKRRSAPTVGTRTWVLCGTRFTDVRLQNVGWSILFLLQSPEYMYYCAYLLMAILGHTVHPFFFAFHLFDVFLRFPELTIVVRAVATPYRSLALTFALVMIAEYLFSIFGFAFFRAQYVNVAALEANLSTAECGMLWSCFLTTVDQTFKNNGGVGAHLTQMSTNDYSMWWSRLLFDNLFNLVILLILVNIFFGIIIDTFGDQRSRLQQRLADTTSKCFICAIDREAFDRFSDRGFEFHCKHEHHVWNYVFLVAHLRFKAEKDFDGVEQYLADCIASQDYSFVPSYRALALRDASVSGQTAE